MGFPHLNRFPRPPKTPLALSQDALAIPALQVKRRRSRNRPLPGVAAKAKNFAATGANPVWESACRLAKGLPRSQFNFTEVSIRRALVRGEAIQMTCSSMVYATMTAFTLLCSTVSGSAQVAPLVDTGQSFPAHPGHLVFRNTECASGGTTCEAQCGDNETLISGSCALAEGISGTPVAMQNAWVTINGASGRAQFSCTFTTVAKIWAQAYCL